MKPFRRWKYIPAMNEQVNNSIVNKRICNQKFSLSYFFLLSLSDLISIALCSILFPNNKLNKIYLYSFHSGQNPLLVSWLQMLASIYKSIALRNPNIHTSFAWNFQVNFKQFHVKPKLVLVAAVVADSSDLRLIPGKFLAFIFQYTISKFTDFLNLLKF